MPPFQAYRMLALEHHPDRHANASEEERKSREHKFKGISEAYSVLSDPDKRRKWEMADEMDEFEFGFTDAELQRALFEMLFGGLYASASRGGKGKGRGKGGRGGGVPLSSFFFGGFGGFSDFGGGGGGGSYYCENCGVYHDDDDDDYFESGHSQRKGSSSKGKKGRR